MSIRCAVINLDTNVVENVIEYAIIPVGVPPGFEGNFIAIADGAASPSWKWNGTKTFDPNPPVPVMMPQQVLSQDLMAQFTAVDAARIRIAIDNEAAQAKADAAALKTPSAPLNQLWAALQAQRDPMHPSNARFKAIWSALTGILGQPRMNAIAAALGVMIV